MSNLCYKNISILQFSHKTSLGHKIVFMMFREFMKQDMYVWSAKSCPYQTEIPPACHVPDSWIPTSDAKHHLFPK